MLQLAYLSYSTEEQPDLFALSEQSSVRNAAEEITGTILNRNHHYLHVLEGPKQTVEDAFLRIIADDRHEHLQLLSRRMVTKRHFGTSSMAIAASDAAEENAIVQVRTLLAESTDQLRMFFEAQFGQAG